MKGGKASIDKEAPKCVSCEMCNVPEKGDLCVVCERPRLSDFGGSDEE